MSVCISRIIFILACLVWCLCNPDSQIDEDLQRHKNKIENGSPPVPVSSSKPNYEQVGNYVTERDDKDSSTSHEDSQDVPKPLENVLEHSHISVEDGGERQKQTYLKSTVNYVEDQPERKPKIAIDTSKINHEHDSIDNAQSYILVEKKEAEKGTEANKSVITEIYKQQGEELSQMDVKQETSESLDGVAGAQLPSADQKLSKQYNSFQTEPSGVYEEMVHESPTLNTRHPHSDTMPSFDEWKKMMLAEQEKGGNKMPSPQVPGKKLTTQKRRRNYASYECGAKIVASNSEAEGTGRILNELVDEYMLNPCKAKIWFVMELCESIQASQIELANFELFSSCPKDFAVYSSDVFPTRDWTPLGTFSAVEQRVLQSFQLKQEGFGKFVKVELLSYYGKEHYCPLSVIHLFGTSMVDEYEEMETLTDQHTIQEDELDRLDLPVEDKSSSNLFGSATDAVYNIVRKAAEVLGHHSTDGTEMTDEGSLNGETCILINGTCGNASKEHRSEAEALNLSDAHFSYNMLRHSLLQHLHQCDQCITPSRPSYYSVALPQCRFFRAALGPILFKSVCDWFRNHYLFTLQKAPIVHIFKNFSGTISKQISPPPTVISIIIDKGSEYASLTVDSQEQSSRTLSPKSPSENEEVSYSQSEQLPTGHLSSLETFQPVIQPTKTFHTSDTTIFPSDMVEETVPHLDVHHETFVNISNDSEIEIRTTLSTILASSQIDETTIFTILSDDKSNASILNATDILGTDLPNMNTDVVSETFHITDDFPDDLRIIDDKFMDIKDTTLKLDSTSSSSSAQKESVFMRMNNRIKSLEWNMSLSSQYLQELSQRYRRQMEEMQRAFNRTIGTLNDTAKKTAERDIKQQEAIGFLQSQVSNLTKTVDLLLLEKSSIFKLMFEIHLLLMAVEVIIMITVMSLYIRRMSSMLPPPLHTKISRGEDDTSLSSGVGERRPARRRNSADSCSIPSKVRIKRRSFSEEPLYPDENLLIVEPVIQVNPEVSMKTKRKNKKKKGIHRSASNPTMSPTRCTSKITEKTKSKKDSSCSAGIIFSHAKTSLCSETQYSCENCNGSSTIDKCSKKCIPNDKEKRTYAAPLKNLTNGKLQSMRQPVQQKMPNSKFSLKKFFGDRKNQKRESI